MSWFTNDRLRVIAFCQCIVLLFLATGDAVPDLGRDVAVIGLMLALYCFILMPRDMLEGRVRREGRQGRHSR